MAPLSAALAGVVLHDHFGLQLCDSGKTANDDLERKKLSKCRRRSVSSLEQHKF